LALGDWHKVDPVYLSLGPIFDMGFQIMDRLSCFSVFETTESVFLALPSILFLLLVPVSS